MNMKLKIGLEKLEEILGGGIDSNSTVLILTDTMVDKASFAQYVLSNRIADEDAGIYLASTKTPKQVINNMEDHGWLAKDLIFVDGLSYSLKEESDAKYLLKENITDIKKSWPKFCELFERAVKETDGFKFVVFDSLETFMGLGAKEIAKKLKEWKELAEKTKSTCLFLFTDWGYKKSEIETIMKSVDLVINLGTIEKKLIWMNYFCVGNSPKIFYSVTPTSIGIYVPKILVTGPFHAGKSSIIHLLSEKAVSVDRLGTTIALDHGYIEKKGVICDIFGTPGQERFDWILKILSKDTWGIILVVDSTAPESFPRAMKMLETVKSYGIEFIVFANKQDLPGALSPKEIAKKLGISEKDVVGTSVVTKKGFEEGLKALFDKIFKV